jgi:hypothetical protein
MILADLLVRRNGEGAQAGGFRHVAAARSLIELDRNPEPQAAHEQ